MPTPHLSDEQLSDALDAGLDEQRALDEQRGPDDHLAGCPPCRQRLAALGEARAWLRTLAPLDQLTRRRLVSRALHAGAGAAHRRWVMLVGAAAALVALLGTPLLVGGGSGNQMAMRESSSGGAAGGGRFLGDLGALGDEAALLAALRDRPDADLSGPAPGARPGLDAESGRDEAFRYGSPEALPPAAGPPLETPQATEAFPKSADGGGRAKSAPGSRAVADPSAAAFSCAAQVAGNDTVAFVGTLRYRGIDAFVVGLADDSGGKGRVIVLATDGCQVLLSSSGAR